MKTNQKSKVQIPLIRLNLALPFMLAAKQAGAPASSALAPFGINELDFLDQDRFVPAPVLYDLVESLADLTGDPYIGVTLGQNLDIVRWSPTVRAALTAQSVGDFLLRFSIDASSDANSAVYTLVSQGTRTTFKAGRLTDGKIVPRQNDAFGVGIILSLLRTALGDNWDGKQVVAHLCDPSVVPPKHFNIRVAKINTMGISVSFPTEWLLLKPEVSEVSSRLDSTPMFGTPETTLDALHHLLLTNIEDTDLSIERVARFLGISKRTLARRMAAAGTTLKNELAIIRRLKAESELANLNLTISEVGVKVGYPDRTIFTRAFKRWTGFTPSEFRKRSS